MALSDLAVFSEYAYDTMTEVLAQQVELFNGASRGTIALSTQANQGDYSDTAFWGRVNGLVRRRNPYGAGAVAEKNMLHLTDTTVKVAAGTPPVRLDKAKMRWIQQNPEVEGAALGIQLAKDMVADMLNTGVMGARVALGQVAAVVHDGTAGTMNPRVLNRGAGLFGDASEGIAAWIMHSTPLNDFHDNALTNGERLFTYGTVNVISDISGRVFVITDSPSLRTAGTPDTFHTLGLVAGGVSVEQNNDFDENMETVNGDENIKRTYQAEWSYNLGVKGFAWDKTNGGKAPNDAALGTATNWDRYATSDKDLAGVLVNTQ